MVLNQNEPCLNGYNLVPTCIILQFNSKYELLVCFQFATINMKTKATFNGARAVISIHNPDVTEDQYSMAQIWIQNGPPAELNSIQAGWAVS